MLILAVHTGSQLGGSTRNLGFIVRTLVQRSHSVHVINRWEDDEGSRYLRQCGAILHYFRMFSLKMNTTAILERSGGSLRREAITTVQDVIKWFVGMYIAAKYILQCRPDIVFVTESALPQFVLVSKWLGVPVVCEIQAEIISGRVGLRRKLYVTLLRRADRIFGITSFHVRPFRMLGVGAERVSVIPNTVEAESGAVPVDIRSVYSIPRDKKILSYFGGASAIKGCRFLLSIVERITTSRDDIVFVVAGPFHRQFASEWGRGSSKDGHAETQYLFDLLQSKTVAPHIRIVGELTDVHALMRASDVVISANSFPHFSRTIIEACYNGVPVLASDDEFSREIIKDGKSGMLGQFGNIDSWVAKLEDLVDHSSSAKRISAEGRKVYDSQFSQDAVSSQIVRLFEQLYEERCGHQVAS